jgi:ribosome-associated protein
VRADGGVVVNRSLVVPAHELQWRFTGSGGPGGQHANTANTKVELRFSIAGSEALGPRQRARLAERLGETVVVTVSASRSQARNRTIAQERLAERMRAALAVTPERRATAPSRSADRRRLDEKKRRADAKVLRRRPATDD